MIDRTIILSAVTSVNHFSPVPQHYIAWLFCDQGITTCYVVIWYLITIKRENREKKLFQNSKREKTDGFTSKLYN